MERPTLGYTATTFDGRTLLVTRWRTVFVARDGVRKTLVYFRELGMDCHVRDHFVHSPTGEYEVWVLFGPRVQFDDVNRAMVSKPPTYNMGVTKK